MRKLTDLEPRLMALTEAQLSAQRESRSWIPQSSDRFQINPTLWSRRARHDAYWRMPDVTITVRVLN